MIEDDEARLQLHRETGGGCNNEDKRILIRLIDERTAERDACRDDVRRCLEREQALRAQVAALTEAGNALEKCHRQTLSDESLGQRCDYADAWQAAIRTRAGCNCAGKGQCDGCMNALGREVEKNPIGGHGRTVASAEAPAGEKRRPAVGDTIEVNIGVDEWRVMKVVEVGGPYLFAQVLGGSGALFDRTIALDYWRWPAAAPEGETSVRGPAHSGCIRLKDDDGRCRDEGCPEHGAASGGGSDEGRGG